MYVSKYYTNEEIDQRLLQGYFDDFVKAGFAGTINEFWAFVLSIANKVGDSFWNLADFIDKMPHGIVDKKIPGIGATTLEINSKRNWRALKKEQTTSLSFLSWRMILSSKLKNR